MLNIAIIIIVISCLFGLAILLLVGYMLRKVDDDYGNPDEDTPEYIYEFWLDEKEESL